ncbi:MFS transporter [Nocardia arizonensis]|uniref:MFS transporter n=1 Tax=Nocardia arizonensis TaxID=1141647 RepID=UPI0006CFE2DF|nr:MFS transporter [Nocardia arizonensis]
MFFGLFAAFLFTVSVTAQTGLGFSALRTGLIMLPFALGGAVGALVSPTMAARWRSRTLTAGLAVFGLAVGTVAVVIRPETGAVDPVLLAAPVFLAGLGMGLFAAPLPAFALAGLGHRAAGAASGVVPTMQQLGTSIGLAAGGVVFFARVDGQAADGVRHAAAVLDSNLAAAGVSTERRTRLVDDFADCVSSTLISPTPVSAPNTCRIGDPAVDGALDAAVRLATGQTFLAAYTTLLWIVAAVALALTVLTPVLRTPEQNHA